MLYARSHFDFGHDREFSPVFLFAPLFGHTLYGPHQCECGRSARELGSYYDGSNVASAHVVAVEPPFRRILWLATLRLFACRFGMRVVVGRFHAPRGSEENARNDNEREKTHFLLVFYVFCVLNNCSPLDAHEKLNRTHKNRLPTVVGTHADAEKAAINCARHTSQYQKSTGII